MVGTILGMIWAFLGPMIVHIAISTGLPAALAWLISKGLPTWLADGLIAIAKAALDQIGTVNSDPTLNADQKGFLVGAIKADARKKAADHAIAGYPSDTKGLDS